MPIPVVPKQPPKLPVLKTAGQAWGFIFRHQRQFWRFLGMPVVVFSIAIYASIYIVFFGFDIKAGDLWMVAAVLAAAAVTLVPLLRMLTGWHRWILLDTLPVGIVDRLRLGKRELLFFLVLAALLLLTKGLGGLLIGHVVPFITASLDGHLWDAILAALIGGVLIFTLTRFMILFPAIAIDKTISVRRAWQMTRGNAMRMACILLCTAFIVDLVADAVYAVVYSLDQKAIWTLPYYAYFRADLFVEALIQFVGLVISMLLAATMLCFCYRQLTDFKKPGESEAEAAPAAGP